MGIQKLTEGLRISLKFYADLLLYLYTYYVGVYIFYTFIFDIEHWKKYTRNTASNARANGARWWSRIFALYSVFPRSKDDVLVVITQDESACRARELRARAHSSFLVSTMHYACVLPQSLMFSLPLICTLCGSSSSWRYRYFFFDIPIRRMERSSESLLRKYCPRQCFTSPKLIKNIIYFTIYKIASIFYMCNTIFYVENKKPTLWTISRILRKCKSDDKLLSPRAQNSD